MLHSSYRSRIVWPIAAITLALLVAAVLVGIGSTRVLGKDSDFHGTSAEPAAAPELSGRTVKISEVVQRGSSTTITTTWAEIDSRGIMTRFRSTTTDGAGVLQQDQSYADAEETVNTIGWMGTSQSCSEVIALGDVGSGIPRLTRQSLLGQGFHLQTTADGVQTWIADGPNVTGYHSTTQEVRVDAITGYDLGSTLLGTRADGASDVIYSRRVEIDDSATPPANAFSMAPLPPCAGHSPA